MRYFVISNFKKLSLNWEKYFLYWEKWNFEPIMNTAHMVYIFALVNTLNKNMDCFMYCSSRQLVK